jgi:hypothetical protein
MAFIIILPKAAVKCIVYTFALFLILRFCLLHRLSDVEGRKIAKNSFLSRTFPPLLNITYMNSAL